VVKEPLSPLEARRLIREILRGGEVRFTGRALSEMEKDGVEEIDCVNVLRGGAVGPGEFENGSWRYRVRASKLTVVVAFRSQTQLVVVTAWREKR
jgi:hypothetical protein